MHIIEGSLPPQWCLFWYIISFTVVIYGIIRIKKLTDKSPELKPLIAVSGAFMFVLSALRLPSVTGSSSHPTGNGLSAVIFGPAITSVLAAIVLLFQALLVGHGGITTLGANVFSMGIIGPLIAWLMYKSSNKLGLSASIGIFLAAFFGDLMTYVTTATQLALAFPIPTLEAAFLKFMAIFSYTQIPLSIAEGYLTVKTFNYILKLKPDVFGKLNMGTDNEINREPVLNKKHVVLFLCVIIIILTPLLLNNGEITGTDDIASSLIQNSGYTPWFESIWKPGDQMETILFGAQAAIGLIIMALFVGYYKKKQNS